MGEMGLLGLTALRYGGAGLDATSSTIVHEELAFSDAGFALAYLAHSALFVNNPAWLETRNKKQGFYQKCALGNG